MISPTLKDFPLQAQGFHLLPLSSYISSAAMFIALSSKHRFGSSSTPSASSLANIVSSFKDKAEDKGEPVYYLEKALADPVRNSC